MFTLLLSISSAIHKMESCHPLVAMRARAQFLRAPNLCCVLGFVKLEPKGGRLVPILVCTCWELETPVWATHWRCLGCHNLLVVPVPSTEQDS